MPFSRVKEDISSPHSVPTPNSSWLNEETKPLLTWFFAQLILFLHSLHFSVSCGKIRLPSTQTASWAQMALMSTSWKGRRWWFSAWENGAALAKSLQEMKSTSSWQSLSRSCTSTRCPESRWTWPQNTVSQWSTNAATWEPQCEQGMSSEHI